MKKFLKSFLVVFMFFIITYSFYANTFAIEIEDARLRIALTDEQYKEYRDKENPTPEEIEAMKAYEEEKGRKTTSGFIQFSDFDEKGNASSITTPTKSIMATLINVIRIVGTGVSIIMITYVAIKYMSAAPNEKAEFKKSATAYIVGAVVLFAATNILQIISNFATTNIQIVQ